MENKDLQNEIVNSAAEKAAQITNETLEAKTASINETLEAKANNEDVLVLAKSIDELKEMSTKKMNVPAEKKSAFGDIFQKAAEGLKTLKKGESIDINTKDFVAAAGDDTYNPYMETRVDAIAYDPNFANRLRNVLPTGTTNGGAVRYNIESAETDSAGSKAKGSAQTQSSVTLKNIHEPVQTLANVLTLPQEWLDDTEMIESYLSQRLIGNLMDVEDNQILKGNGTSPNYSGIQNQDRAAFADAAARATFIGGLANSFGSGEANNFDALVAAQAGLAGENFKPDIVIVHPTDFASLFLAQSSGGGYAIAQIPGLAGSNPANMPQFTVAGMKVISHADQTSGTFTMLDSRYVTYWMREGISFSFGLNENDFASNDITARAKQRGCVTVTRPDAVLTDTFANFITALE